MRITEIFHNIFVLDKRTTGDLLTPSEYHSIPQRFEGLYFVPYAERHCKC